jgi:hypothetical protein
MTKIPEILPRREGERSEIVKSEAMPRRDCCDDKSSDQLGHQERPEKAAVSGRHERKQRRHHAGKRDVEPECRTTGRVETYRSARWGILLDRASSKGLPPAPACSAEELALL